MGNHSLFFHHDDISDFTVGFIKAAKTQIDQGRLYGGQSRIKSGIFSISAGNDGTVLKA